MQRLQGELAEWITLLVKAAKEQRETTHVSSMFWDEPEWPEGIILDSWYNFRGANVASEAQGKERFLVDAFGFDTKHQEEGKLEGQTVDGL